jgi:hypothetical protein
MISKQTQKAASYIFAILAVVLGSIFLVAFAQGYRYDFLTGQIKESGLVLIDSKPGSSDIYVNGKRIKGSTPLRLANAPVGPMNVEITRPEFRVWKKSFTVRAQQVSFADYAILLPQKLRYKNYLPEYKVSELVQPAKQRRSYIITTKPEVAVWRLDNNQSPTKLYAPPPNSGDADLSGLTTSADGSRLLVNQRIGTTTTKVLISGQDASVNLSTNLQVDAGTLNFNPANNNELYWLNPEGSLRKINTQDQTIGPIIAQGVRAFHADGNRLFAVLAPNADYTKNTLWTIDASSSKKTLIKTSIPQATEGYSLDLGKTRSGDYIALLSTATRELMIIRDFDQDKPLTGLLSRSASAFSISPNAERIIYNSDNKLKTYDLEQAERFDFGVNITNLQSWRWYNDDHIVITANSQLRFIDYDGQNDQIISDRGDNVAATTLHDNDKDILYTSSSGLRSVRLTQD